jgi:hypothetical protein
VSDDAIHEWDKGTIADECPAGGEHEWEYLTAFEAGPGWDRGGTRCANCGATPTVMEEGDW